MAGDSRTERGARDSPGESSDETLSTDETASTDDPVRPFDSDTASENDLDTSETAETFQRLGNGLRLDILASLATEGPQSFSSLSERSDADTSAGFAYHLRQLDEQFVRKRDDECYELTAAGRDVIRQMRAGTLDSRPAETVDLSSHCPLCDTQALSLVASDGVATVRCESCESAVLKLPVPPGATEQEPDALPEMLNSYHRGRIGTFADGVCPDCGGTVSRTVETTSEGPGPAQVQFDCRSCEQTFASPATLTLLDTPAVVSFYEDHDESLDQRPLWNVGPEWRERLVSRDPWCLLVSTRLDDELLDLYLGADGSIHESRRRSVPADTNATETTEDTPA